MTAFTQPVFSEGQTVHYSGDPAAVNGTIQSMTWDSTNGWIYRVTSQQIDFDTRTVFTGIITVNEADLTSA